MGESTAAVRANNILGISAYYHDCAAALLKNGDLVAAVLCLDGAGEWATTSTWLGNRANPDPLQRTLHPNQKSYRVQSKKSPKEELEKPF